MPQIGESPRAGTCRVLKQAGSHVSSTDAPIVIVGGGLAGLVVASRLHGAGIGFALIEARPRLGGRILSVDESGKESGDGYDLGPSWFWPAMQPAFAELVERLGLADFAQHDDGDILLQRSVREPPQRFSGMTQAYPSMRVAGGMASIISALASDLPEGSVELSACVTHAQMDGDTVELTLADKTGGERILRSSLVVFAMPPRLLEASVTFTPSVDDRSRQRWRDTPTWMAPHAKFVASYDRPFWRENGLSGAAQSSIGPLMEIHDATTASGKAALFGFVGVSADDRASVGKGHIVTSCLRQLTQLFGQEAARPRVTFLQDWASDPCTATDADRVSSGHPVPDHRPWITGAWQDRIVLAGSETSARDPGYLAGAVDAAGRVASLIIAKRRPSEDTIIDEIHEVRP